MVRHIVMFKLLPSRTGEEKKKAAETVRNELLSLKKKIPELTDFNVEINFNPDPDAFDLVLNSSFSSKEALYTYQLHPDHQAFKTFNKNYSEKKAIVDYEY